MAHLYSVCERENRVFYIWLVRMAQGRTNFRCVASKTKILNQITFAWTRQVTRLAARDRCLYVCKFDVDAGELLIKLFIYKLRLSNSEVVFPICLQFALIRKMFK